MDLAGQGKMGEVHWRAVAAQTLLLQAWLPSETESSLLPHTWFLSAIVPYWALHDTMLHLVCRLSSSKLLRLALLLCFLPWLALVLVPVALGVPLEWYAVHRWGHSMDKYYLDRSRLIEGLHQAQLVLYQKFVV